MATKEGVYHLNREEVLRHFETTPKGLTNIEAKRRLSRYGKNQLTPKKPTSPWLVFLQQFANSLTLMLLVAAGLILFVWYFGEREQSDLIEAFLIISIVLMIGVLGFVQEWRAERAIEVLKKLLAFQAKVVRGGKELAVDVSQLVPGDVIVLEEGTKVPADIRLIEVASLALNEASLTGESVPVSKHADALDGVRQLADQRNMAFSGTVVTQGRGLGVVVETGDRTELGKIASLVADTKEEASPLQKRLDTVGRVLSYIVVGIAVLVFAFIFFVAAEFREQAFLARLLHSFIAAISLAVAAIPEGLPAVVTVALALGTQRMLARKALVRKLNSIETLGSTDVICADKTGTLTKGEMTVRELWIGGLTYNVTGTGYERTGAITYENKPANVKLLSPLLTAGLVCNNARLEEKAVLGDPTEVALLVSAGKAHIQNTATRTHEVPFSSERKMMTVIVRPFRGAPVAYTKGAPETVLEKCTHYLKDDAVHPITAAYKKQVLASVSNMSSRALRTLAFAMRTAPTEDNCEEGLTFIGLQGMIDPPRGEVKPLITQCHESGIRVMMITGDHAATAQAVAHEIGIEGGVLTGDEVDALSDAELRKTVATISIYARANPTTKMRIVEALKASKHTVAMTGDGVNDAPALKRADIGVAMGITGTDVAKESADMVLLDDHFNTIVSAVKEGRGVFDNIRKFVNYLLSCNIGEVFIVFFALLIFQDIPLSATMLLWINVITDGLPAVALGMDPAQKNIMQLSPKRYQENVLTRRMWGEMILFGLLLSIGVLGIYWINLPEGQHEARAAAFMAIVIFELVRLFEIRKQYNAAFFSNMWLLAAIAVSLILQILIVYIPPLARLFEVSHIDIRDWLFMAIGSIVLWFAFTLLQQLIWPDRHQRRKLHAVHS